VMAGIWIAAGLASQALNRLWPSAIVALAAVASLTALLGTWVNWRIWRLSLGRPGVRLLRAGFVLGLLALPSTALAGYLTQRAVSRVPSAQVGVLPYVLASVAILMLISSFAGALCVGLGLLKTDLVPVWVPWVGLTGTALAAIANIAVLFAPIVLGSPRAPGDWVGVFAQWARGSGQVAHLVFAVGLGVTLFWKPSAPGQHDQSGLEAPGT